MHARRIAVLCVIGLCSIAASAQMGGNANGSAPGTIATPAKAFDSQLSLIEEEMMGAVKAMPADQFGFAPSSAIFLPAQLPPIRLTLPKCSAATTGDFS
jgi:hypothetical protein